MRIVVPSELSWPQLVIASTLQEVAQAGVLLLTEVGASEPFVAFDQGDGNWHGLPNDADLEKHLLFFLNSKNRIEYWVPHKDPHALDGFVVQKMLGAVNRPAVLMGWKQPTPEFIRARIKSGKPVDQPLVMPQGEDAQAVIFNTAPSFGGTPLSLEQALGKAPVQASLPFPDIKSDTTLDAVSHGAPQAGVPKAGVPKESMPRPADRSFEKMKLSPVNMVLASVTMRLKSLLDVTHLQVQTQELLEAQKLQQALFEIASLTHSALDLDQIFVRIHQAIQRLMYAENIFIALYDPSADALNFMYFVDQEDPTAPDNGQIMKLDEIYKGPTWHLIHQKKAIRGTVEEMQRQVNGEMHIHGEDSYDWLGVPMMEDGEVKGVLGVQSYNDENRYTQTDQDVLTFIAAQVLSVVQRKKMQDHLEEQVHARTRELREEVKERERGERLQTTLYQIAALAEQDEDSQEFYAHVHKLVADLINAPNLYVALLQEDNTLSFPYIIDKHHTGPYSRSFARGYTEYVMRTGKGLIADRAAMDRLVGAGEVDPTYTGNAGDQRAFCWLGVPLLAKGEVIGALVVQDYEPGSDYTENDQQLLTFVAYQFANSLMRRKQDEALLQAKNELENRVASRTLDLQKEIEVRQKAQKQLNHQVLHDSLTGLPNRKQLRDRLEVSLERCGRGEQSIAVMYMDIDRFKILNDSLGHLVGDRVLQEVAMCLSRVVRAPDVVARIAGDEFVVLIENAASEQAVISIAQRIVEAFQSPMSIDGVLLQASVSVGASLYNQRHLQPDDIMREADQALYHAKENGRGTFVFYDQSMAKDTARQLQLEMELRQGLIQEQFTPYFQPIVDLQTNEITAYEALLRWYHPSRGTLAPGEFLPVAEQSGLIEAIDWAMFDKALTQGKQLVDHIKNGYISINMSPRHFRDPRLDERLMALIDRVGIHPTKVRVEVTEGTLLNNPELALETFIKMGDAGIMIALDDFGTGFSSLNYVNKFPLHTIKIDRSFVNDLPLRDGQKAFAVIDAILTLGRSLNIDIVAEGIETLEQQEILAKMQCGYGQGYFLGRPAPLEKWLPSPLPFKP